MICKIDDFLRGLHIPEVDNSISTSRSHHSAGGVEAGSGDPVGVTHETLDELASGGLKLTSSTLNILTDLSSDPDTMKRESELKATDFTQAP
jgi:hypothetical protein